METSEEKFRIIHEMTSRDNNLLNISELCEMAGVSRSGYYNWVGNEDKRKVREMKDEADFLLIKIAYNYRGFDKGARGIYMRLLHMGVRMNIKKIRRLMKSSILYAKLEKPTLIEEWQKQ